MKAFLSLAQLLVLVAVARSLVLDKPDFKTFEEKCVDTIDSLLERHELKDVLEKPSISYKLQYDAKLSWDIRRNDNVSSIFVPDYSNSSKVLEAIAGDRNLTLWQFYFRLYEDKNKPLEIYLIHNAQPFEVLVFPFSESTTLNKGLDVLIKALPGFKPEDKSFRIQEFNLIDLIPSSTDLTHYRVYERNDTKECKDVQWFVFDSKLSVTSNQIEQFKKEKVVKPTPTRRDTPVVPHHDEKSGKETKGRKIDSAANGIFQINYFSLFFLLLVSIF